VEVCRREQSGTGDSPCWVCSSPVVYLENHRSSGQRGDILAVRCPYLFRLQGDEKLPTAELHGHPKDRMLMWPLIFEAPVDVSTKHTKSPSQRQSKASAKPARGVGFGRTSHGTLHSARGATSIVKWPLRTMSRFVDSDLSSGNPPVLSCPNSAQSMQPEIEAAKTPVPTA